ncbi:LOW QUALITY PROTEIN: hypothetical protein ACHAW6_008505 [Cyclotella cf. meneghiniana]
MIPAKSEQQRFPLQVLCEIAKAVMDDETGELFIIGTSIHGERHSAMKLDDENKEYQAGPKECRPSFSSKKTKFQKIAPRMLHVNKYSAIPERINEPNRCQITLGRDKINHPYKVATLTANLLVVKLLLNSVISTKVAKICTLDTKNFYLCTPSKCYKYVQMHLSDFPEDVIELYKLIELANKDGMVFVEIRRGMYGLPQAGLLAQELLKKQLNKHGYFQSTQAPGLWMHKW